MKRRSFLYISAASLALPNIALSQSATDVPSDTSALADQAFIYFYPIIHNYLTIYNWAINEKSSDFKAPFNQIASDARVFTHEDVGIITPNSDTPYSYVALDLRAQPMVVTLPAVEPDRYYSLQVVDLYTNNVDYLGTRLDGSEGGTFLITGPNWSGEVPQGIKRVVKILTDIGMGIVRTQLKDSDDLANVIEVQKGYKAQTLADYLGTEAPQAPVITWPDITMDSFKSDFWSYANFLLQFLPVLDAEKDMRVGFEALGIAASPTPVWPVGEPTPEVLEIMKAAVGSGFQNLYAELQKVTSSLKLFGPPEVMTGEYLNRALGAMGGIYGNTAQEAFYPAYLVDADGNPLEGAEHNYRMVLKSSDLPPVDAFWSLTMYYAKSKFLVDNPIKRYLINSTMMDDLKVDDNGDIVILIQNQSPGADLESNWLPAPAETFNLVMRLYMPKEAALDGTWTAPVVEKVM